VRLCVATSLTRSKQDCLVRAAPPGPAVPDAVRTQRGPQVVPLEKPQVSGLDGVSEGGLNPPPYEGTRPGTSEKPFSRVAQGLPPLFRSPSTPQLADPATGSN
jgi:hypothetical protein